MSDQPTIVVIGAGIVGASVAYRLAEGGAAVTVVERGEPGQGTSAGSFAWVNANQKTPRPYFDLNHAGMTEHRRLADELEPADWFHPDGNLVWPAPAERDELRERVERLDAWGYDAAWLDARTVIGELEPDVAFADPDEAVAWFAQEAWVDGPALVRRLLDAARKRGAAVRTGTAALEIETTGGRVSGVLLTGGERLAVDAVVNAAGAGAADVAALVGLPLPLANKAGFLVQVGVGGQPVRRILHLPGLNLRPDGHRRLLLQDATLDDQLAGRTGLPNDDPLVTDLIERTRALVPTIGHAPVTAVRVGLRPIPRDGLSCVGADGGLRGYYEAVTHSGVTLGPLLGRLLAREILAGEVDPLLAPFRPDRFRATAT
jgi:glycine/D-amino acid oxidase-like deaminating enzyme